MEADDLKDLLERLEARVRQDSGLARELEESALRFHGGRDHTSQSSAAEQRHREYFFLERESPRFGTTPILGLAPEIDAEDAELVDALCGSHASLFEVLQTEGLESRAVRVEDLASGRVLLLADADFRGLAEVGDLIVGRVFPLRGDEALLSAGAARLHDPELLDAVKRDLGQTRSERPRAARLSQLELEELFFRPRSQSVRALEHVEADLLGFLEGAGSDLAVAEEMRELALGAESVGAFLGPLLEDLAFDTSCDLDVARKLALEYWQAQQALRNSAPNGPKRAELHREKQAEASARSSAVEAFERGRAQGKNLDELFQELESALGLNEGEEEDVDSEAPWEIVGIAPIVEEYAWDRERVGEPLEEEERRQVLSMAQAWDALARPPASVDSLDAAMVRDYALIELPRWVRGQAFRESAHEAACLLRAWRNFDRFCAWLDAEHSTELGATIQSLREDWLGDAERCLALTHGSSADQCTADGGLWVRAVSDASRSEIEIEPLLPGASRRQGGLGKRKVSIRGSCEARAGDLLRVDFDTGRDGASGVLVREVLPGGAEESLRDRRPSSSS
ncbi:MAG: hypothetical protein IPN34_03575 [Planctomycetes bacterium]|nr:hypothetical protein [Planctomycetota bacterium]